MKYEGWSVLTALEAAAIVYMALDGIQIIGSGIWTDVVLFFRVSKFIEVQIARLWTHVTI